jgi:hypothetical protein
MPLIYVPKGPAKEYAELALNVTLNLGQPNSSLFYI